MSPTAQIYVAACLVFWGIRCELHGYGKPQFRMAFVRLIGWGLVYCGCDLVVHALREVTR